MITCLVIDDEPHAVQLLTDYAQKSKDLTLVNSFTNPIDAFHFLNDNPIDLLFLDIQMPELTGLQLLKLIPNKCQVIFTTAYDQYALDGYEFDIIDYLLKPISFERFLQSVEKYKKRVLPQKEATITSPEKVPDYIFVKSGYRTLKINLSEILYLEALSDYVAIFTADEKILTLNNMSYFEEILPNDQFMRVHRSYIISIPKIEFIERNRIIIKEKHLPISKTYQAAFWEKIGKK